MTKVILNKYDGAIVNDTRNTSSNVARVLTNFDINGFPNTLVPYRDSEDGNNNASNDLMQNWCIAKNTSTPASSSDYSLFGLGRQTASAKVRVFKKALTTSSNDLSDAGWTESSNNTASAQSNPNYELFVYYPKLGMIFGAHASRYIYEYDPDGGTAFNETDADLTSFTTIAQGIVHSKDDILYIPYDNKIAKNDNGTWTTTALTLPSSYYITSICEFNDDIAIAVAPVSGVGNSKVFIWDRSTTLATIKENIDWGYGILKILEEVDGFLLGVSVYGNNTVSQKNKIIFRYYTGAGAKSFYELYDTGTGSQTTLLPLAKQKIGGRLHFMLSISLNGSRREGVWSFGRNEIGNWTLIHERTPDNDTLTENSGLGALRGFVYAGDYLFQAFINTSSAHEVTKTNNSAFFTATSIFESTVNQGMKLEDKIKLKQLKSISIGYKTLSAVSGQVVVKYKVDGGSYTTICTNTTTGLNVFEFNTASGVPFTKGREYEFRLESTLGAEIINFEYDYDIIPTLA